MPLSKQLDPRVAHASSQQPPEITSARRDEAALGKSDILEIKSAAIMRVDARAHYAPVYS